METNVSRDIDVAPAALEPRATDPKSRDGQPFVDLIREHRDWLDRECREIAQWVASETGIEPDEVRLSPAWLGEDKRVGVLVFRASVAREPGQDGAPVTDWWIVRERSGARWLYPCLLSNAGDAVRYHHQIRSVQPQK